MINLHLVTGFQNKEHITAVDVASFNAAIFGAANRVLESGSQFEILENVSERKNELRIRDGEALMQGRHIRMHIGDYGDLTLAPCKSSSKRKDLIVIRYIKTPETGVEDAKIIAITGEEVATNEEPQLPDCENDFNAVNNTLTGKAIIADMPLYEVVFENGMIVEKNKLFTVLPRLDNLVSKLVADMTYPIGIQLDFGIEFDPNEIWKGTKWKRITGRVAYAVEVGRVGEMGGSATAVLTAENNGPHNHTQEPHLHGLTMDRKYGGNGSGDWGWIGWDNGDRGGRGSQTVNTDSKQPAIHSSGSGKPFSIMNPYQGVARWQRVE